MKCIEKYYIFRSMLPSSQSCHGGSAILHNSRKLLCSLGLGYKMPLLSENKWKWTITNLFLTYHYQNPFSFICPPYLHQICPFFLKNCTNTEKYKRLLDGFFLLMFSSSSLGMMTRKKLQGQWLWSTKPITTIEPFVHLLFWWVQSSEPPVYGSSSM